MAEPSPVTLETLNEKLDQLLGNQERVHRWDRAKMIVKSIVFVVLVGGVAWAVYNFQPLLGGMDFSKITGQLQQAANLIDQVGDIKGQITESGVQGLVEKVIPKLPQ